MAKRQARPGRTLVVFFLITAVLYGLVALAGSWKPQLGLDLQGGTRITLDAKGDPSQANLNEARDIIDQRVNGSGVTEAEVATQGGGVIVVEIPGKNQRSLVDTVERQAQLRFRLVACSEADPCVAGSGQQTPQVQIPPTAEAPDAPAATATVDPSAPANAPSNAPSNNRVAPGFAQAPTDTPTASPTQQPTQKPTQKPSDSPTADPSASPTGEPAPEAFDETAVGSLDEELAWIRGGYSQADVDLFNSYTCSEDGALLKADGTPAALADNPLKPLVACSAPEEAVGDSQATPSIKYLLSKSIIAGTDLDSADYGIPQAEVQYVVTLDIGGKGKNVFAQASTDLQRDVEQFAIVLDGEVISAPTFQGRIPDGSAQISGNFTEAGAKSLATSLKYGALPIAFEDPSVSVIGPSLAGDQLSAGLTAGVVGLLLVMLYCLIYYRGLGLVVLASLAVAAAITYAMVLLLSETAGFTLTLPGIAGLIIAVGITADSFIILFERIRDEMRDGKSMRVAVESGWTRARNTCLAADAVSLLAAIVLYIFASGVVKGFAFALGLTTLIDLVVFFYFTKPMVSYLARYAFFNTGHRMSGLSAETLGMDRITAGGKA